MTLKHVPPLELKARWPAVAAGLQKILDKCPDTWTSRDVFRALTEQRAHLFACDFGFFIAERCRETHSGEFYLNVWCMYFEPLEGWKRKAELIEQLDKLEAEMCCGFTIFTSPRHEWAAMILGDFTLKAYVFRRH